MIEPNARLRCVVRGVLAVYRTLRPVVGSERAIGMLRTVLAWRLRGSMAAYLERRFGVRVDNPQGAFDAIDRNFIERGERLFGPGFEYGRTACDATRSFFTVRKCFFHDYFRARGAPELTRVFCALDTAWIDELSRPRYGVRFERPATLASGSNACDFHFYSTRPNRSRRPAMPASGAG